MRSLALSALIALAPLSAALAEETDASDILILRGAVPGEATDLISYDALIGGENFVSASDFGFLQKSEDGYAFAGIRVRVTDGLEVTECNGGLAPSQLAGLFEGAYACGEETPVPISYLPAKDRVRPNLLDPHGVWEEEAFFVSKAMSIRIQDSNAISIPPDGIARLNAKDAPDEALDGLIGRTAPPHIQASGACGDNIAVFFPQLQMAGCANAALFED